MLSEYSNILNFINSRSVGQKSIGHPKLDSDPRPIREGQTGFRSASLALRGQWITTRCATPTISLIQITGQAKTIPPDLRRRSSKGNWKIVILSWLQRGPPRLSQLWRMIPSASKKMLTQHLRKIEEDGSVMRPNLSSNCGMSSIRCPPHLAWPRYARSTLWQSGER